MFGLHIENFSVLLFFIWSHQCQNDSTEPGLPFCSWQICSKAFDWLRRAASGMDWLLRACWYNCRLECSVMDDTCCHRVVSGVWERGEWQITHQTAQWGRSECVWVWEQERMFLPLVTMCSHVQGSQSKQQLHTEADKGGPTLTCQL